MIVIFLPKVRKHFESLVPILYENGYFGFQKTAQRYVDGLFDEITEKLPTRLHKPAPKYFDRYGKNMFHLTSTNGYHSSEYDEILEPDEDFYSAITKEELLKGIHEDLEKFFANK